MSRLRFVVSLRVLIALLLAAGSLAARALEGYEQAPFITTPEAVVEHMLAFAGTGPGDTVVDLGSGDGRIVIEAARRFGARAHGIELEASLVRIARENARRAGVSERASFEQNDVLRADFSSASVVTIYLLGSLMNRLETKLLLGLKPGTRIVSHAFRMTGWQPDRRETVRLPQRHAGQGDTSELYLWVVPAQVRGSWRSVAPAMPAWRLKIAQNYQQLDVEAERDGRPLEIAAPRLSGVELAWRAGDGQFSGRLDAAGRIAGILRGPSGEQPLVFERLP